MSRLVEVGFILNECDEFTLEGDTLKSISGNSTPIIDLVMCKDCKWFDKEAFVCFYVSSPNGVTYVDEEDYCSSGEVRDER